MPTKDVEADLAQLRLIAKEGGQTIQEFEHALSKVLTHADSSTIGALLLLLTDDAEYDEVMFSLIHAAESFDDSAYVREALTVFPELRRSAPRWASIVLMRVLNSFSTRTELVGALCNASSSVKENIMWLCERINERNPEFSNKTLPVLLVAKI